MAAGLDFSTVIEVVGENRHYTTPQQRRSGPGSLVQNSSIGDAKTPRNLHETLVLNQGPLGVPTQQHVARVLRRICGVSPTEYRYDHE